MRFIQLGHIGRGEGGVPPPVDAVPTPIVQTAQPFDIRNPRTAQMMTQVAAGRASEVNTATKTSFTPTGLVPAEQYIGTNIKTIDDGTSWTSKLQAQVGRVPTWAWGAAGLVVVGILAHRAMRK